MSSCNSNVVENDLYECLDSEYASLGLDLNTYLDSIEEEMINQGILSTESGESKLNYYRKVMQTNEVPSTKSFSSFNKIHSVHRIVNSNKCVNEISRLDEILFQKSKYFQLVNKMENLDDINPSNVAECYVSIIDEDDLETKFYRAWFILGHVMSSGRNKAYIAN